MRIMDFEKWKKRVYLLLAAEAAKEILDFIPDRDKWLSEETIRDLERLAEEAPPPPKPKYTLD